MDVDDGFEELDAGLVVVERVEERDVEGIMVKEVRVLELVGRDSELLFVDDAEDEVAGLSVEVDVRKIETELELDTNPLLEVPAVPVPFLI